jgi:hypothetical protein
MIPNKNPENGQETKICNTCHRALPLDEFSHYRNYKHPGKIFIRPQCKECKNRIVSQRHRERHPPKYRGIPGQTKICNKCKQEKPLSAFRIHYNKNKPIGKQYNPRAYCHDCEKEYLKEYRRQPDIKSKLKSKFLFKAFGLTGEQYKEKLVSQSGVCAICGQSNSDGRELAVDHNHQTATVRALLCSRCNLTMGMVNESIPLLLAMIEYLKFWNRQ